MAFAEQRRPGGHVLLEPVESMWLFGCPLLGTDPLPALRALLDEEPYRRNRPDLLIGGLVMDTPLPGRLLSALEPWYEGYHEGSVTYRTASLAGGLDGYLSRRSPRLRHNLRRGMKKVIDAGISFERHAPATAAEADAVYDRMLAVEEKSWKGIGACGMTVEPCATFYRLLLRRLSASAAGRVMFTVRDGTDIGFIFGGCQLGRYRGQQFSYAEEVAALGLGNLLQLEQIRWLCEEDVSCYDMGPLMDYKVHWTEIEHQSDIALFRPRGGVG